MLSLCHGHVRSEAFVGQSFQKRHEGFFIFDAERHATIGVLGQIWIEGGAAFHAGAVMLDDFFERGETAVVHVRPGQRYISQGGRREFAFVR